MKYRSAIANLLSGVGLLVLVGLSLVGCNATNDNPITPDKMDEIRKKEASERANFNPTMGGTPKSTVPGGK